MNLLLIGYRGTGKSIVARLLAARLGWRKLDCDAEIERIAGQSIADIFAQRGEVAFRELEHRVLASLVHYRGMVVATGGGVVLRADNRRLLKQMGRVVWLAADAQTIQRRLQSDQLTQQRRPNLTSAGGLAEIVQLLQTRQPLYRAAADWQVDTAGKTPGQVAEEVYASIRKHLGPNS